MNECSNMHERDGFDENLMRMLSQLRVPPSSIEKDEAWARLIKGVEGEERWERLRSGFVRWGVVAVIFIILSSIILEFKLASKRIETPNGKIGYSILPDSTMVTLNAGTIIKHREYGYKQNRIVKLKGEALFYVKPGAVDFMIITGNNTVRVVGTRFNVFYRKGILEVKCLSGIVEVEVEGLHKQILKKGQGLRYREDKDLLSELDVDFYRSTSWTRGEFYFSQVSLDQIFDELQRQFNVRVQVQGFDPKKRICSVSFTSENLRNALDLICIPNGLTYQVDQKMIRIMEAP